jgi:hypothetical protein
VDVQALEDECSMKLFQPTSPGPTRSRGIPQPSSTAARLAFWTALVALGAVGRLWQPGWNITPMAAVALAAGAVFPQSFVAASVPLAALAISNLAMPAYGSLAMAVVVFAATAWPVALGGVVLRGRWPAIVGGALASSLVFFIATNLAHWLLTDDYPRTAEGLAACFVAALPFYRWMPVGDVAWSLAFFGGLAAVDAGVSLLGLRPATCRVPGAAAGGQSPSDGRVAAAARRLD